jgi:hypothetical protein
MRTNPADLLAGALFIVLGAVFLVGARAYEMGTLLRMGSGFYPTLLAGLLIGLGLAILVRALIIGGKAAGASEAFTVNWSSGVPVLGGILAFGLLIGGGGLYVAMPAAVGMAGLGARPIRPVGTIVTALVMTAACDLIFRRALGLPIPALGNWF